jgi:predicted flap endonuclease-1-like 5' DNA nuclease
MKRILGFLIGVSLGIILFYLLKRVLAKPGVPAAVPVAPIAKPAEPPPTINEAPEKVSAKFTVRRTGPRPQARIEDVVETPEVVTPAAANSEAKTESISQTKAEAKTEPAEVSETVAEPATPVTKEAKKATPDDLRIIYDIGEVVNGKLLAAGITTFEQLAATPVEKLAEISGFPTKRIERNAWVEQAKRLAAGLSIEDVIPVKENQVQE